MLNLLFYTKSGMSNMVFYLHVSFPALIYTVCRSDAAAASCQKQTTCATHMCNVGILTVPVPACTSFDKANLSLIFTQTYHTQTI